MEITDTLRERIVEIANKELDKYGQVLPEKVQEYFDKNLDTQIIATVLSQERIKGNFQALSLKVISTTIYFKEAIINP